MLSDFKHYMKKLMVTSVSRGMEIQRQGGIELEQIKNCGLRGEQRTLEVKRET